MAKKLTIAVLFFLAALLLIGCNDDEKDKESQKESDWPARQSKRKMSRRKRLRRWRKSCRLSPSPSRTSNSNND